MSASIWRKITTNRRLLMLIALVVVLAGVMSGFLILKNRPTEPVLEEGERIPISKFDENLLQTMTVKTDDHRLHLYKEDKEWKAEYEIPVVLDDMAVQDLISSFSSLYSEALVAEKPKDLAPYGLDRPQATATATLSDGSKRVIYLGDRTAVKTTYFLKTEDDPRVFAVWMNHAEHFRYSLSDVRNKKLPEINIDELTYLRISKEGKPVFEVMDNEDLPELKDRVEFIASRLYITKPFREPRGTASDRWSEGFIRKFRPPRIEKFVDDRPTDLTPYDLNPPRAELIMKDKENVLHLLLGEKLDDDLVYYQLQGEPAVHAIDAEILDFINVKPFDVADKFAFIINIDDVNWVRVTGRGKNYTLSIKREKIAKQEGQESESEEEEVKETYFLDGKEQEEKPFKKAYQSLIGLLVDAPYSPPLAENPEIRITYNLNKGNRREHNITFVPYNVDFYAVFKNGLSEFLINRTQLDNAFSDLDALEKGELEGN